MQRGGDVHYSADQRLVDAVVHLHAQEESEQQRSEEEMYTLMPSRCRSRGASPCAGGERTAAQGGFKQ